MKIIHTADLHIGAKTKNINDSTLANEIKASLNNSFNRIVKYANDNDIKVIMLSGDVFDSDKVNNPDKKFFYDVIKANPSIDFIYLKGNHDINSINDEVILNLKTFNNKWTSYEYDSVVISGVELDKENYKGIYSSLKLDKEKTNIVMLHGNEASKEGIQDININRLKNKNINYLALGHIHQGYTKEFENKHELVYPGCLTAHGFDETSKKGFYVLNIENEIISKEFVELDNYVFYHEEVDISNTSSELEALNKVKEKLNDSNGIYEIVLKGKISFDSSRLEDRIINLYKNEVKYLKTKNKTYFEVDTTSYQNDYSLKGEFVRNVKSNETYNDEEKNAIITLGLKLLNREEID